MSFVDTRTTASPTSLAAVIGMHALAGIVLIGALSVTGEWVAPDVPTPTFDVRDEVPPPPPPETKPDPTPKNDVTPPLFVPKPELDLTPIEPRIPQTDIIPDPMPLPRDSSPGVGTDPVVPSPVPAIDPVGASPRNDPGRWVTDSDYRSSWIRRDMVGTARFRLEISQTGNVTGCTITRSSGHQPLDDATCRLIERRAKFNPARGIEGQPVADTFESSIVWRLPE